MLILTKNWGNYRLNRRSYYCFLNSTVHDKHEILYAYSVIVRDQYTHQYDLIILV